MPILCATDFSPSARAAESYAAELARRLDQPVLLFHGAQLPYGGVDPSGSLVDWTTGLKQAAATQLDGSAEELRRRSGVQVRTELTVGAPAPQIIQLAATSQAEAIVLGTHGRSGLARLFLGSVAEQVVGEASRPVFVVPADRLPPPDEQRPWRVAVVLDGGAGDAAALDWTADFVERTVCEMVVVRLVSPEIEAARFGIGELWDGFEAKGPLIEALDLSLTRLLSRSLILSAAPRRYILRSSEEAVARTARDLAALHPDLLVLGAPDHRRHAHPRPLRREELLRALTAPAVCVPARQEQFATIPTIRAVLVAVDLGDPSPAAVLRAYALLRNTGGRIELCSVHEPPLTDEERRDREQRLRAMVPDEAEALGIVTNVSILEGATAARAIVQAAVRLGTDVIAVAAHDRRGLARALRGSVSDTVLEAGVTPTLVIHT